MSEDEPTALETLRQVVELRYQRKGLREWRTRTPELTAALRALSREQVHILASELWARYDHKKIANFLGHLNTSVLMRQSYSAHVSPDGDRSAFHVGSDMLAEGRQTLLLGRVAGGMRS